MLSTLVWLLDCQRYDKKTSEVSTQLLFQYSKYEIVAVFLEAAFVDLMHSPMLNRIGCIPGWYSTTGVIDLLNVRRPIEKIQHFC